MISTSVISKMITTTLVFSGAVVYHAVRDGANLNWFRGRNPRILRGPFG